MANTKTIVVSTLFILFFSSCQQPDGELLHKAFTFTQQKKYVDAIDVYSQAIDKDNKLQLAYYNRGCCYADIKQYTKALADFDTVMSQQTNGNYNITNSKDIPHTSKTDVSFDEALYQRAQLYYYIDSVQKATQDFQLLIDDNFAEKCNCLLWQGAIWIKASEKDKACEYFNKSRQLAASTSEKQRADSLITAYCKVPIDSSKK